MDNENFEARRMNGGEMDRRNFIRLTGAGAIVLMTSNLPVMAGPFERADFSSEVPADKKLDANWVKALFERGVPTVHRGEALRHIGMPIGGIGTGQLYLSGDGRLWRWDIFNQNLARPRNGEDYVQPLIPDTLVQQGFALRMVSGGKSQTRRLDSVGFSQVSFCGQYPIAAIEYSDVQSPLSVSLQAFSPFIPLNADDSSLPATIFRFELKNTSDHPVEATLAGWLENAVCLENRQRPATRNNRIEPDQGLTFLSCSATETAFTEKTRPDISFENWDKPNYEGWTAQGTAFGTGPVTQADAPAYMGEIGSPLPHFVNTHISAPGASVEAKDANTGKLTSSPFTIERDFINFWIGGGNHPGKTALNLLVNGQVVRSATGEDSNVQTAQNFDVRALNGQTAVLEIVDAETGGWGQISIGPITFSDRPLAQVAFKELFDYGTMGLALLGAPAEHGLPSASENGFIGDATPEVTAPLADHLVGAIGRHLVIPPGKSARIDFALTWHFPNLDLGEVGQGRYYAAKFQSAHEVARYVAVNFERLTSQTQLWRDTWNDSTLPHWFLDRTFLNISTLATGTCFRLASGRFYAWEGVACCEGTCTHVWHYAHAMARIFPELERDTRQRVDLGLALHPQTGVIGFRAEFDPHFAVDGQAGTLLRIYREHQMSSDNAFLQKNWPHIKLAFQPLLALDGDADGILQGAQMNTLDTQWYGEISWLSSLYVAALLAGEQMAGEVSESEFAARCHTLAARGTKNITDRLFNGEYFINRVDPAQKQTINSGTGCEIDQVLGQSWAHQVHLGRVLPAKETHSALAALWKYNFTPDVGPYRRLHKPGRWYAQAGEAGLLMCTFPRTDWDYTKASGNGPEWATGYFNECMTGFEHQVASHMIWEGMTLGGLAITRAIHDRYDASKRNPWNEIECGDHYARAMASYGTFLAACGFEYHGPKAHIGFAPRLTPEDFKAPFTTAVGWGSYSQQTNAQGMQAHINLLWGHLRLKTLALTLPANKSPKTLKVTLDGHQVKTTMQVQQDRIIATFATECLLNAGQQLRIAISTHAN